MQKSLANSPFGSEKKRYRSSKRNKRNYDEMNDIISSSAPVAIKSVLSVSGLTLTQNAISSLNLVSNAAVDESSVNWRRAYETSVSLNDVIQHQMVTVCTKLKMNDFEVLTATQMFCRYFNDDFHLAEFTVNVYKLSGTSHNVVEFCLMNSSDRGTFIDIIGRIIECLADNFVDSVLFTQIPYNNKVLATSSMYSLNLPLPVNIDGIDADIVESSDSNVNVFDELIERMTFGYFDEIVYSSIMLAKETSLATDSECDFFKVDNVISRLSNLVLSSKDVLVVRSSLIALNNALSVSNLLKNDAIDFEIEASLLSAHCRWNQSQNLFECDSDSYFDEQIIRSTEILRCIDLVLNTLHS